MIPRILSIAAPIFVYGSLALLAWGLYRERKKFDWLAIVPAAVGLVSSFLVLPAEHRLFHDEDIYIHLASNLSRTPVAQLTLVGGPDEIKVATYYKEPAGWPVLLSLVFLFTGLSESTAFLVARFLYAIAIGAVYHLARETLPRIQALVAATTFAAAPICFASSISAGTDIPAALFATLGMWGMLARNGVLAATGLAMAAQTRLELIVLVPLILIAQSIPRRWKLMAFVLTAAEGVHILWVLSVAPKFAQAERVEAAFSLNYVPQNILDNIGHLFNPLAFPALMTVGTALFLYRTTVASLREHRVIALKPLAVSCVYLAFYAGSFEMNPRYSIQLLAPMAVMAASALRWPVLLGTLALAWLQPVQDSDYVRTLVEDHRTALAFASRVGQRDLVVTTEPEVFFNQNLHAMNAVYASEHSRGLQEEFGQYRKVWYYAGARTNVKHTVEWRGDRWVKSMYQLHLIDSREIRGMRIALYEMLLQPIDRKTR